MDPCSLSLIGGDHGLDGEKREIKMFEEGHSLRLQRLEDLFDRSIIR